MEYLRSIMKYYTVWKKNHPESKNDNNRVYTQSFLQASTREWLEKLQSKQKEDLNIRQWIQMDGEVFK